MVPLGRSVTWRCVSVARSQAYTSHTPLALETYSERSGAFKRPVRQRHPARREPVPPAPLRLRILEQFAGASTLVTRDPATLRRFVVKLGEGGTQPVTDRLDLRLLR